MARNYFLPEGFIRKPSFVVSPFNLKTELKHFLCIEILQQVTHNTNKDSIEAPRLQPIYFHGHTEQPCPEPVLHLLLLALHVHPNHFNSQQQQKHWNRTAQPARDRIRKCTNDFYQVTMIKIYSDLWVMCYVIITMLSWVQHHYDIK